VRSPDRKRILEALSTLKMRLATGNIVKFLVNQIRKQDYNSLFNSVATYRSNEHKEGFNVVGLYAIPASLTCRMPTSPHLARR